MLLKPTIYEIVDNRYVIENSCFNVRRYNSSYRVHFTSTRFCSASAEHISLHYHCMLPGQQMYMVLVDIITHDN